MPTPTVERAISAIDALGACLVFPLENKPDPPSLWAHFYPRTPMRWEWDEGADPKVARVWHLRRELSETGRVAYAKWYRGRATFFSLPVFSALVRTLGRDEDLGLSSEALSLYRAFEENSPLSTKEVKEITDLRGRANERAFERGMSELWGRLLVVGFGERDDGAFPSLQVGASRLLLESAFHEGRSMDEAAARAILEKAMPPKSAFRRELDRRMRKRP